MATMRLWSVDRPPAPLPLLQTVTSPQENTQIQKTGNIGDGRGGGVKGLEKGLKVVGEG